MTLYWVTHFNTLLYLNKDETVKQLLVCLKKMQEKLCERNGYMAVAKHSSNGVVYLNKVQVVKCYDSWILKLLRRITF